MPLVGHALVDMHCETCIYRYGLAALVYIGSHCEPCSHRYALLVIHSQTFMGRPDLKDMLYLTCKSRHALADMH